LLQKLADQSESEEDSDSDKEYRDTRQWVTQQNRKKKKSGGFQSMGSLSHHVYKGIIRKGYKIPTPIQRKTIPILLDGKDVVAMARTGSGKTAAFLIPMFERLKSHTGVAGARALVLSPTRELALQTLKFTKEIGKYLNLRAAVILGGDKMDDQFAALHENPDIIIATPGRLLHVLMEMDLKLKCVEYVVFDEADRLFEMGFQEQLNEIIHRLPESRQTLLFSATLPKLLVEFAKAGLHDPTLIRLDVETKLSDLLKMSFFHCREDDKVAVLLYLLKNVINPEDQTVVFAATKHHVEYINMILQHAGISSTYIYSSLDQAARKINVAKFQHKKVKVMIVTDLAARGIDIPLLDNVINYNFPAKAKLFVHRVGRVARAGRSGTAFTMLSVEEMPFLLDLYVFLGRNLKFVSSEKKVEDEDGLCGEIPQTVIDDMEEQLRLWHADSAELVGMKKVCVNAMKKYVKSRPAPAPESIKRFKEMNQNGITMGIHPLFILAGGDEEQERQSLLKALKSYKANNTIFEVNTTAKTQAFDIMKKKRRWHQDVIEKRHQNYEDHLASQKPQDEDRPETTLNTADENDLENAFSVVIGSKRKHQQFVFEPKKKKKISTRDEENFLHYRPKDFQSERGLSLTSGFDQEASGAILDVSGADDRLNNRNKSHEWREKNKMDIADEDDDEKSDDDDDDVKVKVKSKKSKPLQNSGKFSVLGTRNRKWHTKNKEDPGEESYQGKGKRKFKKGKGKRELKRPEQILKARKIKAHKQAVQKHRQKVNQRHQYNKAHKAKSKK
ncbi:hypothetical protein FSP39_021200, partial [Pinctada imbricata]